MRFTEEQEAQIREGVRRLRLLHGRDLELEGSYEYDDGGRLLRDYSKAEGSSAVRALAIAERARTDDMPGQAYSDARRWLLYQRRVLMVKWQGDKKRKHKRRATGENFPRECMVAELERRGYWKAKLPKVKPTMGEAAKLYPNCIISGTKRWVAVADGVMRDIEDPRFYEWEEDGEMVTRVRKAQSVWIPPEPS